ncbi:DUF2092 domain-containing protein [Streptomyces macrosporus]|uniref:Outer membrane lipoprotein carrier protein LolA n=1 Tax=Streptomyces macrosporus TaxID=44032 RepID=A0ABN3J633_9ACTN
MAQTRPIKKALRYAVPATVAGAAAVTVGLVPALATPGDTDLPKISAEELITRIAASDTQRLSGTVKITTDLGLPALDGLGSGGHGGGEGNGGEDGGSEADPRNKLTELASGSHTLRVAADGPDRQRVSLVEEAAEYSLVRNGEDVWAYDSASNTVHHTVLPEGAGQEKAPEGLERITPQKAAEQALKAVDDTTSVTVDGTAKVAGQDAYQLLIRPKQPDSTVESVRIAVDADTGVPLRFTLAPQDGGKAAIDVGFTEVDFSKPAAETFAFKPPKGAEVTEERLDDVRGDSAAPEREKDPRSAPSGLEVIGEGWNSVAEFELPADVADGVKGPEAQKLLGNLTDEVKGDFGTGRFFGTRLVNALITDDGTVYVGAVTRDGLVKAANAAE